MKAPTVHCDDCGWELAVRTLGHLRAWYRAACPECGLGELIDAREVRVVEELLAMERAGLVELHKEGDQVPEGKVRALLDTAAPEILTVLR